MISDRERFLLTLAYARPSHADTIVCLAGEDGDNRALVAAELFKMGMAPGILVTGGRHEPPTHIGADLLQTLILGRGIAHDRILIDTAAQHTYQQAVNTIATAQAKGWKRLILVASHYHVPRAFLTFVRALQEAKQDEAICVVPAAVLGADRFAERLDVELQKAGEYRGKFGHVATYAEGLAYLGRWAT
jgi:uncharacterized SAM-binding protein YcdF (DUF218 family)